MHAVIVGMHVHCMSYGKVHAADLPARSKFGRLHNVLKALQEDQLDLFYLDATFADMPLVCMGLCMAMCIRYLHGRVLAWCFCVHGVCVMHGTWVARHIYISIYMHAVPTACVYACMHVYAFHVPYSCTLACIIARLHAKRMHA